MQKNLHMSKKSCTFAVDLKRSPLSSLKWFTNMYLTYSRLCLIHITENCRKVSKNFLNTQIIMKNRKHFVTDAFVTKSGKKVKCRLSIDLDLYCNEIYNWL